jgi:hypothetical protein
MRITTETQALLDQWYDLTDRPYLNTPGLPAPVRNVEAMNEYLRSLGGYDPELSTNQNIINILGQEAHDLRQRIEEELKK